MASRQIWNGCAWNTELIFVYTQECLSPAEEASQGFPSSCVGPWDHPQQTQQVTAELRCSAWPGANCPDPGGAEGILNSWALMDFPCSLLEVAPDV